MRRLFELKVFIGTRYHKAIGTRYERLWFKRLLSCIELEDPSTWLLINKWIST